MSKLVNVIAVIVLLYSVAVSTTHIIETSLMIGLVGWQAFTSPILVDAVFLLGKLGRSKRYEDRPGVRKGAFALMLFGGGLSLMCNLAAGGNMGQRIHGVVVVVVMVWVESFAAKLVDRVAAAVAMVAKSEADAALAAAMATAAADMAVAVATAVKEAEQVLRATLAAEAAELVAEAERATREAAAGERLAAAEADRVAMAKQLANAAATATAKPATVANLATARAANGQASAAAAAILAEDMNRDTAEVAKLSGASERTVRRVRSEMRLAMVAA